MNHLPRGSGGKSSLMVPKISRTWSFEREPTLETLAPSAKVSGAWVPVRTRNSVSTTSISSKEKPRTGECSATVLRKRNNKV